MHVYITGRVQGVLFRDWTCCEAQSQDLTGWVRNLPDGRVEAIFEGPENKLGQMLKRCRDGSEAARVDHVEAVWEKATGEFKSFEIIYH